MGKIMKEEFIKRYFKQCKLPPSNLLEYSNLLKNYLDNSITIGAVEAIMLANGWKKITLETKNNNNKNLQLKVEHK